METEQSKPAEIGESKRAETEENKPDTRLKVVGVVEDPDTSSETRVRKTYKQAWDDNDEGIRNTALEALTDLGKVYPRRLFDLTGKSELKHKHKKECVDLAHCLKCLNFEQ